jgi:hypothetical protein
MFIGDEQNSHRRHMSAHMQRRSEKNRGYVAGMVSLPSDKRIVKKLKQPIMGRSGASWGRPCFFLDKYST